MKRVKLTEMSDEDLNLCKIDTLAEMYVKLAEMNGVSDYRARVAHALILKIKSRDRGQCGRCKHWGDGDGTGMPYDAGRMNWCRQNQIDGDQHPSHGACGDPKTMLWAGAPGSQLIMTRIDFGCNLFEPLVSKTSK